MKIKIIQYYIGNNEKYLQLCNIVKELNSKYSQLHNYEYNFSFIENIENPEKLSVYELGYKFKLNYIYDNLNDCDILVFIDADALISNPNILIENLIDDTHDLFLSRGNGKFDLLNDLNNLFVNLNNIKKYDFFNLKEFYKKYKNDYGFDFYVIFEKLSIGNRYFNEGFFIIKNTNKMKKFFKLCIDNVKIFNSSNSIMGNDGRCISFFLNNKEFKDCDTYLPDYTQGHVFGAFDDKYDEDKTFIQHNYGECCSLDDRIKYANIVKTNKWWKIYNL